MRVCFLAGTLGRGGAERQLVYMLRALQTAGVETRVLSLTRGEAYESVIEKMGVEIDWVGMSDRRPVRLLDIVKNLRRRPADVLQSVHFYTNMYAGCAGRLMGIKSIGAIRSDLTFELKSNRIYGKWQLRLPEHLISNSMLALERASSHGVSAQKIDYLRNAVDIDVEYSDGADQNEIVNILFVGRLSEEKRPDVFVNLAERLATQGLRSPLRFLMAGDGPLRSELERAVNRSESLRGSFSFLGQLEDLTDIYRRSDILVLTSAHEGTPNVVLEAMAYGIPVVATDVGGVHEIVDQDRGLLVDPHDLSDICGAVNKLAEDPELRSLMGNNGRRYVVENHSLAYLGGRLTDIYQTVINGSRYV